MTPIESLRRFTTAELADAMGGENVMDVQIRPIHFKMKLAGPAFTIHLPFENGKKTMDAIAHAPMGAVIVISTSGSVKRAVWGDVRTTVALQRGVNGVVVDGPIRDVNRIAELGLPVFYKYISPASYADTALGETQVTIECGGLSVSPGDYIVGDDNGVVVIPASCLETVCEVAAKKLQSDEQLKDAALRVTKPL